MEKYCNGEVTSMGEAKMRQEQSEIEKVLGNLAESIHSYRRLAVVIRNQVFSPMPIGVDPKVDDREKNLSELIMESVKRMDETNELLDEIARALKGQFGSIRII